MNIYSKLPDYLKYEIISFIDYKCVDCQKRIPFFEKHIIYSEYHFCSKECRYSFFLYAC